MRIDGIGQLCTPEGPIAPAGGEALRSVRVLESASIAIEGEKIVAVGPEAEVRRAHPRPPEEVLDARGGVVLPGWVDPHTHLLFAGSREGEFEQRTSGRTYQEIAAAGGGIRSSVRAFRAASDDDLLAQARRRLDRMLACGTTSVEVKSGYGLSVEEELRALRLIARLDASHAIDLIPTFLGAHEIPDEYRTDRAGYVRLVIEQMLPRVAASGGARFCDAFCEAGVFDVEETRAILAAARRLGLGLKLHSDEFEPLGGTPLAVELGATSVDHLIAIDAAGIEALAHAARRRRAGGEHAGAGRAGEGTAPVAVLLPSTCFSLAKGRYAPARALIDRGIPVALATDCNPGSSMNDSMPLVLQLAVLEMRLLPAEAIHAATANAAFACGVGGDRGRLEPGFLADLQILEAPSWLWVVYALGLPHVRTVVKRGRVVLSR